MFYVWIYCIMYKIKNNDHNLFYNIRLPMGHGTRVLLVQGCLILQLTKRLLLFLLCFSLVSSTCRRRAPARGSQSVRKQTRITSLCVPLTSAWLLWEMEALKSKTAIFSFSKSNHICLHIVCIGRVVTLPVMSWHFLSVCGLGQTLYLHQ